MGQNDYLSLDTNRVDSNALTGYDVNCTD